MAEPTDTANLPRNEAEWYVAGLIFGWQHPDTTPEAPAPLDEPFLSVSFTGCEQGAQARRDEAAQEPPPEGPSIGPDLGGQSLDEFEAEGREILEGLFHQHMPHTELPEFEPFFEPFGGTVQPPVP
jgi:hypothetical protein